ncbi:MAG: glycosyltransferase [Chitinophagales bacterium]
MDQLLTEKKLRKPRILVTPLDWGLGHATRCIPVVRELLRQGCDVWLAGEGAQQKLLQQEFPALPFLQLDGYRVHYAQSAVGLVLSIFRQTHKIYTAIRKENAWLKKQMKEYGFDAVISDNRYGLYDKKIPCVFITHQLKIKSSLGKWIEKILQRRNYLYINRFAECWVPDNKGEKNLAGELSRPEKKPAVPVHYIGWLSRMKKKNIQEQKKHLLILLSGPEPQRSILEDMIVEQIAHYNGTATVVRGLPVSLSMIPSANSIHFYNHLPAEELNTEMEKAEFVIARSGYSTVMDIIALQKKSILIPTPGQTEQEYLGKYLSEKQIIFCTGQKKFSLQNALEKVKNFPYLLPEMDESKLSEVVSRFINSIKQK